ncbi:glutathione S-transferase-like [Ischnura elegans]|uniref:glutathione S-transferase-like n=1 Tax=Ischnura elegans TaxID=197161 RepID=UPI001ED8AB60|nr:glutathione S-transferase-like [Ischnura elegans]
MAPKYKLIYFDTEGLGEPIRFLFAYAGVPYEDFRFKREDWPKHKDSAPFGKVPLLEVDGKTVHQSVAICRYLANQFKLAGDNAWESVQCDMLIDSFGDLRDLVNKLFYEQDEEKRVQILKDLRKDTFPYYLKKFDEVIAKNNGHFVAGKLTWCDLYIVCLLDVIQGRLKEDIVVKDYPNVKKIYDTVMNLPAIKAWVAKRPKQQK